MKRKKSEHHLDYKTALIQLPLVRDTPHGLLRTPESVVELCAPDLRDIGVEVFNVLVLDSRNRLLNRCLVGVGILDSTLVHPREVFRNAIVLGGAAIILVHNHPSGNPEPSAEDIKLTRQMVQAGEIIGIRVLDHIIIGRVSDGCKGYRSLRESGVCTFPGSD